MNTPVNPSLVLRTAKFVIMLGALAALSACSVSTISSRSKEKADAYARATPAQKQTMDEGWIDEGFTKDMVYIALGKPDHVVPATDEAHEVWVYMNFDNQQAIAGLGMAKTVGTQVPDGGDGSSVRGANSGPVRRTADDASIGVQFQPRNDPGSAQIAEEMPRLYVHFVDGEAIDMELKRF